MDGSFLYIIHLYFLYIFFLYIELCLLFLGSTTAYVKK